MLAWIKVTGIFSVLISTLSLLLALFFLQHIRGLAAEMPDDEKSKLRLAKLSLKQINLMSITASGIVIVALSLLSLLRVHPFSPGQALAIVLPAMWVALSIFAILLDEAAAFATVGYLSTNLSHRWLFSVSMVIAPLAFVTLLAKALLAFKLVALSESFSASAFALAVGLLPFAMMAGISSASQFRSDESIGDVLRRSLVMRVATSIVAATVMLTIAIAMYHRPLEKPHKLLIGYPLTLSSLLILIWLAVGIAIRTRGIRYDGKSLLELPLGTALSFAFAGVIITHEEIIHYGGLIWLGVLTAIFILAVRMALYRKNVQCQSKEAAEHQFCIVALLFVLGMIAISHAMQHGYGIGIASIGYLVIITTAAFEEFFSTDVMRSESSKGELRFRSIMLSSALPIFVLAMRLLAERQSRALILPIHSPILFISACAGALTILSIRSIRMLSFGANASEDDPVCGISWMLLNLLSLLPAVLVATGSAILLPMLWGLSASAGFIFGVALALFVLCFERSAHNHLPLNSSLSPICILASLALCIGIVHSTQILSPISYHPRMVRLKLLLMIAAIIAVVWMAASVFSICLRRRLHQR